MPGRPKAVSNALNRPIPDVLLGAPVRAAASLSRGRPISSGRTSRSLLIFRQAEFSKFLQPEPCPGGTQCTATASAVAFFVSGYGRPKTVTRALNRPIPDVLQGQGLVGRPVWSLSRGCPTFSGRPSGRPRICRRAYSSNFPQPEPCPGGGSMYGHCIAVAFFVPGPGRPDVRKRPPWS